MLKLRVLSPERTVLDTDCDYVTLPAADGQITVYPRHAPLYTLIQYGEVIAHTKGGVVSLGVGTGFANITATQVVVLTNFGILSEEADDARAAEAKARAEDLIKNRVGEQDMALAQAELSRSLLELKLANKRKH
jgi:F-type H+-transporting ATPase subunit epsilon